MFDWVLVYLTFCIIYIRVLFLKMYKYFSPYTPSIERVDDNVLKVKFSIDNSECTVFLKKIALHPDFRKCYIEDDICNDVTDEIKSANRFIQVNVTPKLLGYKYLTCWKDDDPKIFKANDFVII